MAHNDFSAIRASRSHVPRGNKTNAFSLVELMVVLAVVAAVIAFGIPSFQRAIEQSRADVACANLRAVWAAERMYWLEGQCYCGTISFLQNKDNFPDQIPLLDPNFNSSGSSYIYNEYSTPIGANPSTGFTATATPTGVCTGSFSIDETGVVSGTVSFAGWSITPTSFW